MQGLLIAEQDMDSRKQIADLLIEAGYNVIVTNSAANAVEGILKKAVQVVILGSEFDDLTAGDLVPLLKQCNRNLTIILVSADDSLPVIRRLRKQGIFYHALKPVNPEDRAELCQAVQCAFASLAREQGWSERSGTNQKYQEYEAKGGNTMKTNGRLLMTTAMLLGSMQSAHAASTTTVYNSGWLVLVFFGLCALVVTVQLIPALMLLAGMLKGLLTSRKKANALQRSR